MRLLARMGLIEIATPQRATYPSQAAAPSY